METQDLQMSVNLPIAILSCDFSFFEKIIKLCTVKSSEYYTVPSK